MPETPDFAKCSLGTIHAKIQPIQYLSSLGRFLHDQVAVDVARLLVGRDTLPAFVLHSLVKRNVFARRPGVHDLRIAAYVAVKYKHS